MAGPFVPFGRDVGGVHKLGEYNQRGDTIVNPEAGRMVEYIGQPQTGRVSVL